MAKMYSDPTAMFVKGSDQETFNYKQVPGALPWNIYLKYGGVIYMSAMVFATDSMHALTILQEYIEWYQVTLAKYKGYKAGRQYDPGNDYDLYRDRRLEAYKWGLENNAFKFSPCDMTQFYKIGWAGNDTW